VMPGSFEFPIVFTHFDHVRMSIGSVAFPALYDSLMECGAFSEANSPV